MTTEAEQAEHREAVLDAMIKHADHIRATAGPVWEARVVKCTPILLDLNHPERERVARHVVIIRTSLDRNWVALARHAWREIAPIVEK